MKKYSNEEKDTGNKPLKSKNVHAQLHGIFLAIFVCMSVILGLVFFFYYKLNQHFEEEISMLRDIHYLKALITSYKGSSNKIILQMQIKGYIEISEVFEGLNILGKIEGLSAGTTHALHILEFSDISNLEQKKVTQDHMKHYNPLNAHHSCPSNGKEENYHMGDLGNIIANNEGVAYISLIRKIPIRSLSGRIIVITMTQDKCNPAQEYDSPDDIIGYGLLNAFRQDMPTHVSASQDFFVREINTVKKKEFEKENIITQTESKKKSETPRQEVNVPGKNLQVNNSINDIKVTPQPELNSIQVPPRQKEKDDKKNQSKIPKKREMSNNKSNNHLKEQLKIQESPPQFFKAITSLSPEKKVEEKNTQMRSHKKKEEEAEDNIYPTPLTDPEVEEILNFDEDIVKPPPKSKGKQSFHYNEEHPYSRIQHPIFAQENKKEERKPISLAQIPNKPENLGTVDERRKYNKNDQDMIAIDIADNDENPDQLNESEEDSSSSVFSPNMEPIVSNLMHNDTSVNLIKNIDEDLINPYVALEMHSRRQPDILLPVNISSTPDFDFRFMPSIAQNIPVNSSQLSSKSNDNSDSGFSIFNNLDTIQKIVANRTLNELKSFKESPVDIPLDHPEPPRIEPNKKPLVSLFHKYPDLDLIKFVESGSTITFDNERKKKQNAKPSLNSTAIFDEKISESAHKMIESIDSTKNKLVNKMKKVDKGKLFLRNVKENIKKIDKIFPSGG